MKKAIEDNEFNPFVALAAAFAPPLIAVGASMVIGEFAFYVWLLSVLVGAYYTVRRLSLYPAMFATAVYWVLMLFEFIAVAMCVPGLLVLHE